MTISTSFEIVSLLIIVTILLLDVIRNIKNPVEPTNKQSLKYLVFYIASAVIFGLLIYFNFGHDLAIQFYSGWLTEYSLSIDNLFVFILIISNFKVPRNLQKEALGVGIVFAIIMRGIFILIGVAIIEKFSWVFYIFGLFLIYTAIKILVDQEGDEEYHENIIVRFFYRIIPMSSQYNGTKLRIIDKNHSKTKKWTPLIIVFVALGVTDLFFALDSIPAIFGLTTNPFIVFTANVFALMGLQQLYFILGSLIKKLQFLPLGLAIILAFIGVKLIFEAFHESGFTWAPEVPNLISLLVIVIVISVTAIASIMKIRKDDRIKMSQISKGYKESK